MVALQRGQEFVQRLGISGRVSRRNGARLQPHALDLGLDGGTDVAGEIYLDVAVHHHAFRSQPFQLVFRLLGQPCAAVRDEQHRRVDGEVLQPRRRRCDCGVVVAHQHHGTWPVLVLRRRIDGLGVGHRRAQSCRLEGFARLVRR